MAILDESVAPESILEANSTIEYIVDLLRPILSKVVVALIILIIGFIVGKLLGKTVQWMLRSIELNKRWKQMTGLNWRIEAFAGAISAGFVYFIVVIMTLTILGLSAFITKLLSFGIICIVFISIILAVKDFIPNYISGFTLYKKLQIKDKVIVDSVKGIVEEITWSDVKIKQENGDILYIPHSLFLKKGFKKIA
ncbi:MAG: mechanosensitive ion channel domain-containing protein [Candidatus Woesearchaeota archaeon]|jgi:small-conductance mechanosensitive channel